MAMMGCPFQPSFAQGSATAGRRQSGRLRGEQGRDLIYKFVEKRPKIPDFRGSKLIHESTMAEALSYGYLHVDGIGTEQFDYCYNALEGVAVDGKVCFPQYKEFLYELSNGQVSEDDPPEVFVLIFHSTACSNGQDCAHNDPYISLDQEGVNLWVLRVLCEEVLSHLVTETTVSFEFSLRYDPDLLDAPTLAECISNATENLLYDHFGCSNNDDPSRQRELQGLKAVAKSTVSGVGGGSGQAGTPETMEDTREMALIQEVFSSNAGHWDRDTCPYSVMTEVIILDIGECTKKSVPEWPSERCILSPHLSRRFTRLITRAHLLSSFTHLPPLPQRASQHWCLPMPRLVVSCSPV